MSGRYTKEEPSEEEQIFDAIEPALDAAGFNVDEGDDDTIYVTSKKSGKSFVITVNEEE